MTIKELLFEAEKDDFPSLVLFIDFLLNEKKVIQLNDPISVLDLYLLEKHKEKMNRLLSEYIQDRKKGLKNETIKS